ncbi:hypothetical protein BDQ12DRAFT_725456 [Crucibulum laeve]|uniref:DUF6534 domain-containing protein n=1 Tax=Crucibulum laeve TaxID=68775 RepID=A0A5C3LSI7_9AGAR|nr:hypothetical protein BDQ12DRAFT_725456 [Crucibulum laeve]
MAKVQLLYGPMLIGVFLNMILYGILVVQMYEYYRTFKKDTAWLRYLILYLFIVETINTGFNMGMMYEPLILKFGTDEAIKNFPIMLIAEPLLIVCISTPIQVFIAWRLGKIIESWRIPSVIGLLALCSFCGGIWTAVEISIVRVFARKPELHTPALVWLVSAAAADILITASLTQSLYTRKTGYAKTDAVISRIIALTIQTGLITAIAALADVLFFLVLPKITINLICDFALTKLYVNSLMSTLNARVSWNNRLNETNVLFDEVSPSQPNPMSASGERFPAISLPVRRPRETSSMFDLEEQKSQPIGSLSNMEIGIAVTTTIERRTDSPQAF